MTTNEQPHAVGTATEFVTGERRNAVCYATFDGDFADQSFRFR